MSPSRQQTIIYEDEAGLGAATRILIHRLQPGKETKQFLEKTFAHNARNPVVSQNTPVELFRSI